MADYRVRFLDVVYVDEDDLARALPLTTHRSDVVYRRGDDTITLEIHDYPLYGVYARLGFKLVPAPRPITGLYGLYAPEGQPVIDGQAIVPPYFPAQVDNLTPAPRAVIVRQQEELAQLGREFDIIYWEHFRHCYPEVARHLKTWFKHSISHFADDCPVCARTKNGAVAACFDSAIYGNVVFDRATGLTTEQFYRQAGVSDTHYVALGESRGLLDGLAELGFSHERKLAELRAGRPAPIDLVFVGPKAGPEREALVAARPDFAAAGLEVRIHGIGMPDGVILPREAAGLALATLYASAFAGVGLAQYGLAGTRLWDYWAAGMLNCSHDQGGELAILGAEPNVHYAAYDGTMASLLRTLLAMKHDPASAARIIEAGWHKGVDLKAEYQLQAVLEEILFANLRKWKRAD